MIPLQQIIHDIAKKGSDAPFEKPKVDPYRVALRANRRSLRTEEQKHAVQLSLFQNQ